MSCVYENRIDVVIAYVRNELSDKELNAFEEHYLGCKECADQIIFVEKTTLAMNRYGNMVFERLRTTSYNPIISLLDKLDESVADFTAVQWLRPHAPALVGITIMLFFLSFTFILSIKNPSHEFSDASTAPTFFQDSSILAIYRTHIDWSDNFSVDSQIPSTLSREFSTLQNIYQNDRNYKLAANKLSDFILRHPEYADLQLFLGASLLQIKNSEAAAENLQAYLNRNPKQLEAKWLLTGVYLQFKNKQKVIKLLSEIALTDDSKYRELALKELKRLSVKK